MKERLVRWGWNTLGGLVMIPLHLFACWLAGLTYNWCLDRTLPTVDTVIIGAILVGLLAFVVHVLNESEKAGGVFQKIYRSLRGGTTTQDD